VVPTLGSKQSGAGYLNTALQRKRRGDEEMGVAETLTAAAQSGLTATELPGRSGVGSDPQIDRIRLID
jgi:hypothetical protein